MAKEDIVVVAVDGSDASKNAVRWAANTAMKREIPLRIASSYTIPQFLYAEGMVPPKDLYDDLQDETLEKIEEARAIAHEVAPELKIGHTIAEGSPIDMLLEMSHDVTMVEMPDRSCRYSGQRTRSARSTAPSVQQRMVCRAPDGV